MAIGDLRCRGGGVLGGGGIEGEEGTGGGRAVEGGRGGLGAVVVDGGADLEAENTASFKGRQGRERLFVVGGLAGDTGVVGPLMPLPSLVARAAGAPMRACILAREVLFFLCLLDGTRESR